MYENKRKLGLCDKKRTGGEKERGYLCNGESEEADRKLLLVEIDR